MVQIGYHASHEQFSPRTLITYAQLADQAGFTGILASDHFHPWSERQGESGFVWSWLGSALEATSVPYGTVTAPGYRYHPAVIAQAAATLREMYPDRFWLSVGSGELLNEHITDHRWPGKPARNERLEECIDVMRQLWTGDTVSHHGRITVDEATLYTLPTTPPPIIGAALTPETARWLGEVADGLITVATPDTDQLEAVITAFHERAPEKPVYVKAQLSYHDDEQLALDGAYDQWRTNAVPGAVTENLRTTEQFDAVGETITRETVTENVRVSADLEAHKKWIRNIDALGVEMIFLHNVNRDQERFIRKFGDDVLPSI